MSASPPKKKNALGTYWRRDGRLMDGGGRDLRGSLPNSTSTDTAPILLQGRGGTAMNPFLNDHDGLI